MTALVVTLLAADASRLGLDVGLDAAFASAGSRWNDRGERLDYDADDAERWLLAKLALAYGFDRLGIDGLAAGLELPLVWHTRTVAAHDSGSFNAGDASVWAAYDRDIAEGIRVGAHVRFKAATGVSPYDEPPANEETTGSGHPHLHGTVRARGGIDRARLGLDAGYIWTVPASSTAQGGASETVVDPGDYVFVNLSLGWQVVPPITPRLHLLWARAGGAKAGKDGALGEVDRSSSGWLALALDVEWILDSTWSARAGFGTPLDAAGVNLPFGYPLAARNVESGGLALHLGVRAAL